MAKKKTSILYSKTPEELLEYRKEFMETSYNYMSRKYHIGHKELSTLLGAKGRVERNRFYIEIKDPEVFKERYAEWNENVTVFLRKYGVGTEKIRRIFGEKRPRKKVVDEEVVDIMPIVPPPIETLPPHQYHGYWRTEA